MDESLPDIQQDVAASSTPTVESRQLPGTRQREVFF